MKEKKDSLDLLQRLKKIHHIFFKFILATVMASALDSADISLIWLEKHVYFTHKTPKNRRALSINYMNTVSSIYNRLLFYF